MSLFDVNLCLVSDNIHLQPTGFSNRVRHAFSPCAVESLQDTCTWRQLLPRHTLDLWIYISLLKYFNIVSDLTGSWGLRGTASHTIRYAKTVNNSTYFIIMSRLLLLSFYLSLSSSSLLSLLPSSLCPTSVITSSMKWQYLGFEPLPFGQFQSIPSKRRIVSSQDNCGFQCKFTFALFMKHCDVIFRKLKHCDFILRTLFQICTQHSTYFPRWDRFEILE